VGMGVQGHHAAGVTCRVIRVGRIFLNIVLDGALQDYLALTSVDAIFRGTLIHLISAAGDRFLLPLRFRLCIPAVMQGVI
jgi:hypothetical protein